MYTAAEFTKRSRGEDAFATRVLQQPKVWISDRNMTSPSPVERLAGPENVLAKEAPDAKEFPGLVSSGLARLSDADNTGNSLYSRFDLTYGAAHALCARARPSLHRTLKPVAYSYASAPAVNFSTYVPVLRPTVERLKM